MKKLSNITLHTVAKESWKENKDEEFDFEMDGDYYVDGFKEGYEYATKKMDLILKDLKFALSWACVLHNDHSADKKKLDRLFKKYK